MASVNAPGVRARRRRSRRTSAPVDKAVEERLKAQGDALKNMLGAIAGDEAKEGSRRLHELKVESKPAPEAAAPEAAAPEAAAPPEVAEPVDEKELDSMLGADSTAAGAKTSEGGAAPAATKKKPKRLLKRTSAKRVGAPLDEEAAAAKIQAAGRGMMSRMALKTRKSTKNVFSAMGGAVKGVGKAVVGGSVKATSAVMGGTTYAVRRTSSAVVGGTTAMVGATAGAVVGVGNAVAAPFSGDSSPKTDAKAPATEPGDPTADEKLAKTKEELSEMQEENRVLRLQLAQARGQSADAAALAVALRDLLYQGKASVLAVGVGSVVVVYAIAWLGFSFLFCIFVLVFPVYSLTGRFKHLYNVAIALQSDRYFAPDPDPAATLLAVQKAVARSKRQADEGAPSADAPAVAAKPDAAAAEGKSADAPAAAAAKAAKAAADAANEPYIAHAMDKMVQCNGLHWWGGLPLAAPQWTKFGNSQQAPNLNLLFLWLWPQLHGTISKTVEDSLNGLMEFHNLESLPAGVELVFDKCNFEQLCPKIHGVTTYSSTPECLALDLDLAMICSTPVNLRALVTLPIGTVTVCLGKLRLEGKLRVELKGPIKDPPWTCMKMLTISFVEQPVLEFTLDTLSAVDVNRVMGLGGIIRSTVAEYVQMYVVWPNKIEVPMVDVEEEEADAGAAVEEEGVEGPKWAEEVVAASKSGGPQKSLAGGRRVAGWLQVALHEAEELRCAQSGRALLAHEQLPHFYAGMWVSTAAKPGGVPIKPPRKLRVESRVVENTLHPVWHQEYFFTVYHEDAALSWRVYSQNVKTMGLGALVSDDVYGEGRVEGVGKLAAFDSEDAEGSTHDLKIEMSEKNKWPKKPKGVTCGTVRLQLRWYPNPTPEDEKPNRPKMPSLLRKAATQRAVAYAILTATPKEWLLMRQFVGLEEGVKGVEEQMRRKASSLFIGTAKCFSGADAVAWFIQRRQEIDTVEQAVAIGNRLMALDLFEHIGRSRMMVDSSSELYEFNPAQRKILEQPHETAE